MGRTATYEAIVLKTYDVGEADRFCILFTRERGRMAARARAVRKLQSRMGGSLLPLRHLYVDLHEGKAGYLITGVQLRNENERHADMNEYYDASQVTELLLHLLQDEEAAPDIFELFTTFLSQPHQHQRSVVLPFTLHLLTLLGIMSSEHQSLSGEERRFVAACADAQWLDLPAPSASAEKRLRTLCSRIVEEQTSRVLKSERALV